MKKKVCQLTQAIYLCIALDAERKFWPVHLSVRIQDFHSWQTGSTPVRATKRLADLSAFFNFTRQKSFSS